MRATIDRLFQKYPETTWKEDARLRSPTLLISAGEDEERDFNVLYDKVGNPAVEHWNLPDAHHTAAIREHRPEYERRVVAFFDQAMQ